jgi:simple sugar transport system substrate-binding protein
MPLWIRIVPPSRWTRVDGWRRIEALKPQQIVLPFDRSQTMLDRMRFFANAVARALSLAALASALAIGGAVHAEEPLKVAFVYVGPVGDAGWTYAHDQGRQALEKALGSKVKTTYVENVAEGADAERVIRQLATEGNKVIFTVYEARFYEGAYLLGVMAGQMTKTNTLGFIASFPIPEVIRNIDAYTLGAQSVNPKVKTKVIWVNTWYDPAKERQAAETLIAQGADMLCQNTDSPAIVQVAQEKGIYAFGWDSDMKKFAPKSQLTANTNNWGVYYIDTVKKVLDGTWKPEVVKWGLKEGVVVMAPLNSVVPPAAAKVFEEKKKALIDGKLTPFQGPVKDQSGAIKVPAGSTLPLEELMSLNWYVEGVEGSIPK